MASGDTLLEFTALSNEPTAANFATFDTRNAQPVLNFDAGTSGTSVFSGVLPRNYAGGGITVNLHWAAGTATSGTTVWTTAFESVGTTHDIDGDGYATGILGTTATQGTAGLINITSIAHTDGAQIDSAAVGLGFRLQVSRTVADASDQMGGTAQLRWVELKET
jgi:hypothetical protein